MGPQKTVEKTDRPLWSKLIWFVLLWAIGVGAVTIVAMIIRTGLGL
jgi:hypothetical protein